MSGMAIRRHTLDAYGTELYLVTNRRDWTKLRRTLDFLDKKKPRSAGLSSFALFEPKGGGVTESHLAVWIDKAAHKSDLDLIETAAHEASHGVGQIFEWIGHDHRGTDEPSAYLTGWLTRWIVEGAQ